MQTLLDKVIILKTKNEYLVNIQTHTRNSIMNLEDFVDYCLAKPGVEDDFPFGPDTLVFKVMGKMFALADAEDFQSINLKCDPELALELREQFDAVKPGYHMNKTHWNTVAVNRDATDKQIFQWIDISYNLVVKSFTKKLQEELKGK